MASVILYNIVRFIALVILQVALFKNMGYYNLASPFPYILFIFLLPLKSTNFVLYVAGFLTGLTIDAFYDSLGVHAAACVALIWFRISFNKVTLDPETIASVDTPSWGQMGSKWFMSYVGLGTLLHHLVLYVVEAFSFKNLHLTLLSAVLSSIFTLLMIVLFSMLFYKRKSRLSR